MGAYTEIQENVIEALQDAEAAQISVSRYQDAIDPVSGDLTGSGNSPSKTTHQPLLCISLPLSAKNAKGASGFEKFTKEGVPKETKLFLTSSPVESASGFDQNNHVDDIRVDDVISGLNGTWLVIASFSFKPNGQESLFHKLLVKPSQDFST